MVVEKQQTGRKTPKRLIKNVKGLLAANKFFYWLYLNSIKKHKYTFKTIWQVQHKNDRTPNHTKHEQNLNLEHC